MFGIFGEEKEGQRTSAHCIQKIHAYRSILREESEHRPAEKRAILSSLVPRPKIILLRWKPERSSGILKKSFRSNGCCNRSLNQAILSKNKPRRQSKNTCYLGFPPSHKIKTVHMPVKKTFSPLGPVKYSVDLKTPDVYCIPC